MLENHSAKSQIEEYKLQIQHYQNYDEELKKYHSLAISKQKEIDELKQQVFECQET